MTAGDSLFGTVAFMRDGRRVVFAEGGTLYIGTAESARAIAPVAGKTELVTVSPRGTHIAFWVRSDESFHLITQSGRELWALRINTDRATPHQIRFSLTGDAVAFSDDFDGAYRMRLFDFGTNAKRTFGSSFEGPIGFDQTLSTIVDTHYIPKPGEDRDGSPSWAIFDLIGRRYVRAPANVDGEPGTPRIGLVDRSGEVLQYPPWDIARWQAIAYDVVTDRCVVVNDGVLSWYRADEPAPEHQICDAFSTSIADAVCHAHHDLVLLHGRPWDGGGPRAALVVRDRGIVWRSDGVEAVDLEDQRALITFSDGHVTMIDREGATLCRYEPTPDTTTVAAALMHGTIHIARRRVGTGKLETVWV